MHVRPSGRSRCEITGTCQYVYANRSLTIEEMHEWAIQPPSFGFLSPRPATTRALAWPAEIRFEWWPSPRNIKEKTAGCARPRDALRR
jgi:hypothetical protein